MYLPHKSIFLFIIFALAFGIVINAYSQNTEEQDYFDDNYIRNEDHIYKSNIKTVLLYKLGWKMSSPIIQLNTDKKLHLTFDDLDADYKYYGYTIIHCDANWQISDLKQADYIDGFYEDDIWDYDYSFNTTRAYTNYHIDLPTDYLKFTKSGNYILRVYVDEYKEKNVIFTRRFMVVDQKVSIRGRVNPPLGVQDKKYKQAVDFTIIKNNYNIPYPYQKLKVIITQNRRWDNAITDLIPRMIKGDELDYDYDDKNVFDGGNEFRAFDIKSLVYQSERIKKMYFDADGYQVYLLPDKRRTFDRYIFEKDINGKRYIEAERITNADTEADYVYVHFSLPYEVPLIHGNVYIVGELTAWQLSKEGLMKYNFGEHVYEATLYLKQGYYNYAYVFLEDGFDSGDITLFEGNHFDTENEYTIYVYHREEGTYYDQLIAVDFLNSLIRE